MKNLLVSFPADSLSYFLEYYQMNWLLKIVRFIKSLFVKKNCCK